MGYKGPSAKYRIDHGVSEIWSNMLLTVVFATSRAPCKSFGLTVILVTKDTHASKVERKLIDPLVGTPESL